MEIVSMIVGWVFFSFLLVSPFPILLSVFFHFNSQPYSLKRLIIGLAVGWCLVQTSISFLLGFFHALTWSGVLLSQVLLLLAGVLILSRTSNFSIQELVQSIRCLRLTLAEGFVIISIVLLGLVLWYRNSSKPITDFDSLYYHLPMAVNWFQTGNLTRLSEYGQISQYPYNWELASTLFLFAFHTDFQILFPNYLIWAVFGASIFALARDFGVSRLLSIFMAGVALILPITRSQLNSLHVDLPFAGFFLAALYFSLDFAMRRNLWSLNLFLAALGMIVGIKMSGLGYVVLLIVWCAGLWLEFKPVFFLQPNFLFKIFPGLITMCLLGGYWYVVNWLEVRNPMGYLQVSIGPIIIFKAPDLSSYLSIIHPQFPELTSLVQRRFDNSQNLNEYVAKTTLTSVFKPGEIDDWQILWSEIRGQGGSPFLLMMVLAPFGLWQMIKQSKVRSWIKLAFCFVLFGTVSLFLYTPYSGDNGSHQWQITPWIGQAFRYALPFFGAFSILSSVGFNRFTLPEFIIPAIFLMLIFVFLPELAVLLIVLGLSFLVARRVGVKAGNLHPKILLLGSLVLMILIMTILSFAKTERENIQAERFQGLEHTLDANGMQSLKIGYLASFFRYPLYGINLNHEVVFAPAKTASQEEWINSLREQGIDMVSIGPFRDEEWLTIREYSWLRDKEGAFVKVHGFDPRTDFVVFRLMP